MSSNSEPPIPSCYLCEKRKASKRKSHFTPASATEGVFGKRAAEEVYAISADESKIEVFFGRENKKNTDPTIRKDLTSEAFVFCKECEEQLGKLEHKVTPLLNQAQSNLKAKSIIFKRTAKFQKYFTLDIHPRFFALYLSSVIWRQSFRQVYDGKDSVLSLAMYNKLREVIAEMIYMDDKELLKSQLFETLPNLLCFTTIHQDEMPDFANPSSSVSNPELFFMGAYDCLLFKEDRISPGFRALTGLKFQVNDVGLSINEKNGARVAIIPYDDWKKKRQIFIMNIASTFNKLK